MKQALNFADNQILEIYGISTASWDWQGEAHEE